MAQRDAPAETTAPKDTVLSLFGRFLSWTKKHKAEATYDQRKYFLRSFVRFGKVKRHALEDCPLAFTMDFIEGANLRHWVGAADSPADMLSLMLTVADTLRHAHSRGVVHRDVKPENIIVAPDEASRGWVPFLTDFDLAWFSTATGR